MLTESFMSWFTDMLRGLFWLTVYKQGANNGNSSSDAGTYNKNVGTASSTKLLSMWVRPLQLFAIEFMK